MFFKYKMLVDLTKDRVSANLVRNNGELVKSFVKKFESDISFDITSLIYVCELLAKEFKRNFIRNFFPLEIAIAVPSHFVSSVHRHVSRVVNGVINEDDLVTYFSDDFHTLRNINYNYILDDVSCNEPVGKTGYKLEFETHQEIINRKFYKNLINAFTSCGLGAPKVYSRAYSAAVGSLSSEESSASILISHSSTTGSVLIRGFYIDSFHIAMGKDSYVEELMKVFKMDREEAKYILENIDYFSLKANYIEGSNYQKISIPEILKVIRRVNEFFAKAIVESKVANYKGYIDSLVISGAPRGLVDEVNKRYRARSSRSLLEDHSNVVLAGLVML